MHHQPFYRPNHQPAYDQGNSQYNMAEGRIPRQPHQHQKQKQTFRPVKTHCPYSSSKEYMETYLNLLIENGFGTLKLNLKKWLDGDEKVESQMNVYSIKFDGFKCGQFGGLEVVLQYRPRTQLKNREARFNSKNLFCISPSGRFKDKIWGLVMSERGETVSDEDTKSSPEEATKRRNQISLQIMSTPDNADDAFLKLATLPSSALMVDSKQSFISTSPVLRSLRNFNMDDGFCLRDEIVKCRDSKRPPRYLGTFTSPQGQDLSDNIGMLTHLNESQRDALEHSLSCLDESQREALKHTLSSRLAIIQGPPGCGKTYIGKTIVKWLLALVQKLAPPILVLSYKNHALDEFLKGLIHDGILSKNRIARVGGECEEPILDACKLENLRKQTAPTSTSSKLNIKEREEKRRQRDKEIGQLKYHVEKFGKSTTLTWADVLSRLSDEQIENWLQPNSNCYAYGHGLRTCLLKNLDNVDIDYDLEYVDYVVNLFHRARKEWVPKGLTRENIGQGGRGSTSREGDESCSFNSNDAILRFADLPQNFCARPSLQENTPNLWYLSLEERRLLLRTMLAQKMDEVDRPSCQDIFRRLQTLLEEEAKQKGEQDAEILKSKKLVGMTITGASTHSALVHTLRPEIVIVEEAGEVLEPDLLAALTPGLQHLILIGDHRQLRPVVETRRGEFDVSMMERLINNKFPFRTLNFQSRMRPEFSKLLLDIYPNLQDNMARVSNNKPLGCIAKPMFFWTHSADETDEGRGSFTNSEEAHRVTQLVMFMLLRGVLAEDITVLCSYRGQVRLIKAEFERLKGTNPQLLQSWEDDNTSTIDSYQGDENRIIIVSLVRSNPGGRIGFLKERNRRCVAQSRAQCGMYFVGNKETFCSKGSPWRALIEGMDEMDCVDSRLPLQCDTHKDKSIKSVTDGKELEEILREGEFCKLEVNFTFPDCQHQITQQCFEIKKAPQSCVDCMSKKTLPVSQGLGGQGTTSQTEGFRVPKNINEDGKAKNGKPHGKALQRTSEKPSEKTSGKSPRKLSGETSTVVPLEPPVHLVMGPGLGFLNMGEGISPGKTSEKASGKTSGNTHGRASVTLCSKPGKANGVSRRKEEPPRKRAKTKDTLVPEKNRGSVTLKVVVPVVEDKPEWKLKGQTLQMSVSSTDTVKTLKTKIMKEVGMPQGKQKLLHKDVFLKDENTLAFYNIMQGTKLELKERSGR